MQLSSRDFGVAVELVGLLVLLDPSDRAQLEQVRRRVAADPCPDPLLLLADLAAAAQLGPLVPADFERLPRPELAPRKAARIVLAALEHLGGPPRPRHRWGRGIRQFGQSEAL